jgi:endonuclease III
MSVVARDEMLNAWNRCTAEELAMVIADGHVAEIPTNITDRRSRILQAVECIDRTLAELVPRGRWRKFHLEQIRHGERDEAA